MTGTLRGFGIEWNFLGTVVACRNERTVLKDIKVGWLFTVLTVYRKDTRKQIRVTLVILSAILSFACRLCVLLIMATLP